MSEPEVSSSQASILSTSSSQLPLGKVQALLLAAVAVTEGVDSAGWPFRLDFLLVAGGVVDDVEGRPRFLVVLALDFSSNSFSRPPSFLRYSSKISDAPSLTTCQPVIERSRLVNKDSSFLTSSCLQAPRSGPPSFRSPPT